MSLDENIVNSLWSLLEKAIQEILRKEEVTSTPDNLHSNTHTLVSHGHRDQIYNGLKDAASKHLELQFHKCTFIPLDLDFILKLNETWNDHTTAMDTIFGTVLNWDRFVINDEDASNILKLKQSIFGDELIRNDAIKDRFQESMASLVMAQRNAEEDPDQLTLSIRRMLIELKENNPLKYKFDFEGPLLERISIFYKDEAQRLLSQNSSSDYIIKVYKILSLEARRPNYYMDVRSTKKLIINVIEHEMVQKHMNIISKMDAEFTSMIKNNNKDGLIRMCRLFTRVKFSVVTILQHVERCFSEAFHQLMDEIIMEPISIMQTVFDLKNIMCLRHTMIGWDNNLGITLLRLKKICGKPVRTVLSDSLLESISNQRNGTTIDQILLKGCREILRDLNNDRRFNYETNFEEKFIDQAAIFYKSESAQFMKPQITAIDYIKKIDAQISQEIDVINICFDEETMPRLIKPVEDELIRRHMKSIVNMDTGAVFMLENKLPNDLNDMYKLLSRVEGGVTMISECVEKYFQEKLECLVANDDDDDQMSFLKKVLDLKDRVDGSNDGFNVLIEEFYCNEKIQLCVSSALLESILQVRNEEVIHTGLIKETSQMLMEFDIKKPGIYKQLVEDYICKYLREQLSEFLINVEKSPESIYTAQKIVNLRNCLKKLQESFVNKRVLDFLVCFNEITCDETIRNYLCMTLLALIKRDRHEKLTDRNLIKSISQLLREDVRGKEIRSYKSDFEIEFLAQSTEFFCEMSHKFLSSNNAIDYIALCEALIKREKKKIKFSFSIRQCRRTMYVVNKELIENHVKTIIEMDYGIKHMLEERMTADLSRLYKFFSKIQIGIEVVSEYVTKYIYHVGSTFMKNNLDRNRPIDFIQNLLDLKNFFDSFMPSEYNRIISNKIEHFLNENQKASELIVQLIDEQLNNDNQEDKLDTKRDIKVMVLFRHLQDKDLFEQLYKLKLANRLLSDKRVDFVIEQEIISQIRAEGGFEFTSSLERMLKDIKTSEMIMKEFKDLENHKCLSNQLDLSVKVLTNGLWPNIRPQPISTIVNTPMVAFKAFKKFYLSKHSGRRLVLQTELGAASLKMFPCVVPETKDSIQLDFKSSNIDKNRNRNYMLNVSSPQMFVLLLFNDHQKLTFEEILEGTGLTKASLIRAIQSMLKGKSQDRLLLRLPKSKTIEASNEFCINNDFFSVNQDVNFQPSSYAESKQSSEVKTTIDVDRRHEIEAAIVRIMKCHRTMEHKLLVDEVALQMKSRFVPSQAVIKKRIEHLIENEYLSRTPEKTGHYDYMP